MSRDEELETEILRDRDFKKRVSTSQDRDQVSKLHHCHLHITVAIGAHLKAEYTLWSVSEYIIWVDNTFLTKMRKIYARNTSRGPRQVPRSPPLNTPLLVPEQ